MAKRTSSTPPALLRLNQAASLTNLSRRTLQRAIRRGELQAYRLGGAVVLTPTELQRWVREQARPFTGSDPLEITLRDEGLDPLALRPWTAADGRPR